MGRVHDGGEVLVGNGGWGGSRDILRRFDLLFMSDCLQSKTCRPDFGKSCRNDCRELPLANTCRPDFGKSCPNDCREPDPTPIRPRFDPGAYLQEAYASILIRRLICKYSY